MVEPVFKIQVGLILDNVPVLLDTQELTVKRVSISCIKVGMQQVHLMLRHPHIVFIYCLSSHVAYSGKISLKHKKHTLEKS